MQVSAEYLLLSLLVTESKYMNYLQQLVGMKILIRWIY
jgi:hypothetical protein